ncbi:MAG TPA: hypothetical protein VK986_07170, partial [Tepidisphaeraceae bacterium]|nr:hypothetical protein [Tepidisphaeraceae bacterium]
AERETGDGPPPRPLRLKDKTVGEAVGALLQRFDRPDAPLTYVVENGWVVIGTEDRLAARDVKMTRAYEVGDLETPAERLDSGVTWYATVRIRDPLPSRLRELVSETLNAQVYRRQSGGVLQTTVQVADRWLIVHGSAQAQRDAQRLLFMLRNGRLITESRGGASTRPATTTSATQPTTKEGSR